MTPFLVFRTIARTMAITLKTVGSLDSPAQLDLQARTHRTLGSHCLAQTKVLPAAFCLVLHDATIMSLLGPSLQLALPKSGEMIHAMRSRTQERTTGSPCRLARTRKDVLNYERRISGASWAEDKGLRWRVERMPGQTPTIPHGLPVVDVCVHGYKYMAWCPVS